MESGARSRNPKRLNFTSKQALNRIDKHEDLFAPVLKLRQRLPQAPSGD